MHSFVFVQDFTQKITALFQAIEDLSSAWWDYCQGENKEVPKDFFQKIINVCETYDNLRSAAVDHDTSRYATLPMAAD